MEEQEQPPILKRWSNVYGLVIGTLVTIILFLYFFTRFFE